MGERTKRTEEVGNSNRCTEEKRDKRKKKNDDDKSDRKRTE